MVLWIEAEEVKLNYMASEADLQATIRAAYRQVLGNAHVMESQRLTESESQLRDGRLSVAGFVRAIGQSSLYKSMFFETSSCYRFIELNFKHFLGRAPQSQAEIAEHSAIYHTHGYAAEIDSYIDSDEYQATFGENSVPYLRGNTQTGVTNVGFNRTFAISRGNASNDISKTAMLLRDIGGNIATKITSPAKANGGGNRNKRFRITVAGAQAGPRVNRVIRNKTVDVSFDQLSPRMQSIQKSGGTIVNIAELS